MKFVAAKCPSCQGELQVPEDKDFVKCLYCGVEVKVREAIKISLDTNIPNLMELANSSLKSGNNEEAYKYFNKILEFDIKNYDAWLGKGVSASLMSSLANPRHQEMLNYFDNAVKYYNKEDIENYKVLISSKIQDFCISFFEVAKNHKDDFITVDSTWPEYLMQCSNIISVLQYTFSNYSPKDNNLLKWIIHICEDNLKGTIYYEQVLINNRYQNMQRRKSVSEKHKIELTKKIQDAKKEWRKLEPDNWKKHDEWINETIEIKKLNQKTLIKYISIFFVIGLAISIVLGLSLDIPHKKSETDPVVILGLFVTAFFTGIGALIASTVRKEKLPPEPKGLK